MEKEYEIDLIQVLADYINYLKNKKAMVVISFVMAASIAALIGLKYGKTYSSSMTVTSNTILYDVTEPVVKRLNEMIEAGNIDNLSSTLGIDKDLAGQLLKIESEKINVRKNDEFLAAFTVSIKTKSPDRIQEFEEPIMSYLNGLSFIQERTNTSVEQLNRLNERYDAQIERLDSIQQIVPEKLRTSGLSGGDYNFGTMYNEMMLLNLAKSDIEKRLVTIEEFQKVIGFTQALKDTGIKFVVVLGAFLAFVFTLVFFFASKLSQLVRKRTVSAG